MAAKKDGIYFTLGPRRAVWKSNDESISLTSLPNENGVCQPHGFVSDDDDVNKAQVLRAIAIGQLMKLQGTPKKLKAKSKQIDITNKRDNEIEIEMKAKALLRMNGEALLVAIKDIKDVKLLQEAILLESKGKNKGGKKRDSVLVALKERLEKAGGITDYIEEDGVIRASVDLDTQEGVGKVSDE